jgi:sugar lactone lactonase YvrE
VWTESFSRRVLRLVDGQPELVVELPERHAPDGCCVGAGGELYVASTVRPLRQRGRGRAWWSSA